MKYFEIHFKLSWNFIVKDTNQRCHKRMFTEQLIFLSDCKPLRMFVEEFVRTSLSKEKERSIMVTSKIL